MGGEAVPLMILAWGLIWESHSSPRDLFFPAVVWPFTSGAAHGFSSRMGSTDGSNTVGTTRNYKCWNQFVCSLLVLCSLEYTLDNDKHMMLSIPAAPFSFLPWEVGGMMCWVAVTVPAVLVKLVRVVLVVVTAVVAAVEWAGEVVSGEENGSVKLDKRERPADSSWHMADTASPCLFSTTGELSGMGVTRKGKLNLSLVFAPILLKSCAFHTDSLSLSLWFYWLESLDETGIPLNNQLMEVISWIKKIIFKFTINN